ncbi:Helix-turn-helix domain-containing protein [Paenibacillus sp. UNCCL117]|uniref:helix-turn-helix domain-containing protein n=1 Tax=unclassified Paenibacillus TaxID=185978 RepID=UPI0008834D76|nr:MULTISPECIES: helix-turn-helix domain-containing protein [unclassified Paenibacillus]SDC09155.1 Helix-turn-helix domain-containing protein [Paenibacillus sp. cl123]SFW38400.1 Helix-turn-helix domain-containing protein [Paenibacillus sp. UNCCL117]
MIRISIKNSSVFLSLLISFVIVMLVPIGIGSFLYARMSAELTDNANRAHIRTLEQIRLSVDNRMVEVDQLTSQLALYPKLQWLLSHPHIDELQRQFTSMDMMKQMQNYRQVNNSFVTDFYLYVAQTHEVLTSYVKSDARLFFDRLGYDDSGYESFVRSVWQSYHNGTYMPAVVSRLGTVPRQVIPYVQSLPLGETQDIEGTLVILIDQEKLVQMLDHARESSRGAVFILNSQRDILAQSGGEGINLQLQEVLPSMQGDHGAVSAVWDGEEMLLTFAASRQNGWIYISAVPRSEVMAKAMEAERWALALLLVCLIAGIAVSYMLAYRSYRPLKQMVGTILSLQGKGSKEPQNEFDFIRMTLIDTLEEERHLRHTLDRQMPVIQANYLSRVIRGHADPESVSEGALDFMGLSFESERFAVMVFDIGNISLFAAGDTEKEWALVRFIVSNVTQELLEGRGYVSEMDRSRITVLVNFRESDEPRQLLRDLSERFQVMIRERFRMKVAIGIGGVHETLGLIADSYREALYALDYTIVRGENAIIFYEEVAGSVPTALYYPVDLEVRLMNVTRQGDSDKVEELLEHIRTMNLHEKEASPEKARYLCWELSATLLKLRQAVGLPVQETGHPSDPLKSAMEAGTVEEMLDRLKEQYRSLCEHVKQTRPDAAEQMYRRMEQYVHEHCTDASFSAAAMAEHFRLTSPYLSSFFKKQGGSSITDYVARVRVERAKELLRQSTLTLTEIADQVGFLNNVGFIRVFKKLEGITPGKYREAAGQDSNELGGSSK